MVGFVIIKQIFNGVYSVDGKLATLNLVKGKKVYGEDLVRDDGREFRMWTPYRSKLSAAIMKGLKEFHIEEGGSVLYLGAANGTTPSHISDIVGAGGRVFAVEMSERSMRDLISVCETRENMLPILADAHRTELYSSIVGTCDVIYQDVSAREQAQILKANSRFLNKGGYAYFIIKSQSVDMTKDPESVFRQELAQLEDIFDVVQTLELEPYDSAHLFAVLKKK